MARTALTVQTVITSGTGLAPSYATVDNANGNYFTWPGGRVFLHVKNTNAATRTLTIDAPQTIDGLAMTDPTYTIAATTGEIGWPASATLNFSSITTARWCVPRAISSISSRAARRTTCPPR